MFKKIRRPASRVGKTNSKIRNVISFTIFGLICLAFVFIGVPFNQNSYVGIGGVVALVNNHHITMSEFQNVVRNLEERSNPSQDTEENDRRQNRLYKTAIEQLISSELMAQAAPDLGIFTSKRSIQDFIAKYPLFQEEGRFIRSKYKAFLQSTQYSASYFERIIKKQLVTSRLQRIFNQTIPLSRAESQKDEAPEID